MKNLWKSNRYPIMAHIDHKINVRLYENHENDAESFLDDILCRVLAQIF